MFKRFLLFVSAALLLTSCDEPGSSVENTQLSEQNAEMTQTIKELREENTRLQEQVTFLQESVNEEEARTNLRETLNMTFKLMAAMESEDTAYIESVSSPNVEITSSRNAFVVRHGDSSYEADFIKSMLWDEFEFRGYDQKDSDHFMLFIARTITTKGSEGKIEYEFSFIRSPEGEWFFDGYIS
ncbi:MULTISPECIES: hypothetical protein [Paenibacillus]|uniref:Uncharacterized protein n=1 Tax=Paenibacillus xylanilyticus TaxID=248903 RepID=A0A7Y6C1D3_9BACL|nr:hypothetical protein [Paenibacillus xylanilyticus]NUU78376.1 hypothetical protein [Paenibacillus xylanilyticus]